MVDEIELAARATAAKRAELLINDDLLKDAFNQLEQDYFQAWKNSGAADEHKREKLWLASQLIAKVRQNLLSVMVNGRIAQKELDHLTSNRRQPVI